MRKVWSLPGMVWMELLNRQELYRANGMSKEKMQEAWREDVELAIEQHGILDPLWNPQAELKLT